MSELKTEFLFDMIADIDREMGVDVGTTPHGTRRIVYVKGGTFEGPKIKGVVLPGGGDWVTVRPDGASVLDVRLALRTDDGHIIYMVYRGIVFATPEVRERMSKVRLSTPRHVTSGRRQSSRPHRRSMLG